MSANQSDIVAHGRRLPLSQSARIVAGIASGALLGVLIGERTSALQIVADGYIKLLQMTVLPYVTVSIIGGLGALDAAQARTLGKRMGVILAGALGGARSLPCCSFP